MNITTLPTAMLVGETVAIKSTMALNLQLGQLLLAQVNNLQSSSGKGNFLLPDGTQLSFTGGQALTEGETVQLQVARLSPEVAVRVVNSESATALHLARNAEQTLLRAPDTFKNVLEWSGLTPRSSTTSPGTNPTTNPGSNANPALFATEPPALLAQRALAPPPIPTNPSQLLAQLAARAPTQGTPLPQTVGLTASVAATLVTGQGESLLNLLRTTLPNVSGEALLRGDFSSLQQLLTGEGRATSDTVRFLRQAASTLHPASNDDPLEALLAGKTNSASEGSAVAAAKTALNRLADLLTSQELLPRHTPMVDGSQLLGYRTFWLPEGGFGEAIWKQESDRQNQGNGDGKPYTTVLLALEMSQLGAVQAKLGYSENALQINIAAEDEAAIAALRDQIATLRTSLQAIGAPLRGLEVMRLNTAALRAERQAYLGLNSGFVAEV